MTLAGCALVVAVALPLGSLVTEIVRRMATRIGAAPPLNPIVPQHRESIPDLGGLALGLTALLTYGLIESFRLSTEPPPLDPGAFLWPALAFLLLGLVDDRRPLSAATKLLGQTACAAFAVGLLATPGPFGHPVLDAVFAIGWIVTVVNACNVTDVCDGLLSSIGAIAFAAAILLAPPLGAVALPLMVGCLAVFTRNAPPARIFLGDGGSHLLGFGMGLLSLHVASAISASAWGRLAVASLLCAAPLFELVFVTLIRIRKGLPWWRGSPDHFALRVQARGHSRWAACCVAWCLAISGVALARIVAVGDPWLSGASLLLAVAMLTGLTAWLLGADRISA